MSEISRKVLEAIDVIAENKVSKVKADLTAPYVICDISRAKLGEYKVSSNAEGAAVQFTVYKQAGDTYEYKVGDAVYILIPGGKYSERKFIVGLQKNIVQEETKPSSKIEPTQFVTLNSINAEGNFLFEKKDGDECIIDEKVELVNPLYLVNYNKIRLTVNLKVNIGEKDSLIDNNSGSYSFWFQVEDKTTGQNYIYDFSSNDIFGNLYHFGDSFYSFSKDIEINPNNFRIDSYCFKMKVFGDFKDTEGNSIDNYKIEIKSISANFGWFSSEYQDGVYIYEQNNMHSYPDNTTATIGAKINYGQKEINENTLSINGKEAKIYWCWQNGNEWECKQYDSNIKDVYALPLSINISSVVVRAELREGFSNDEPITEKGYKNKELFFTSNQLKFDSVEKISYNYSMNIKSSAGWVLKRGSGESLQLIAVLSWLNREFTVQEVQENQTNFENFILYQDNNNYFIWEDNGKRFVSFEWLKGTEEIIGQTSYSITVKASDIDSAANYTCNVIIGEKGG